MHEFNICQNIVDMVLAHMQSMDSKPRRLVKTTVVIGGLRQIVPEYLQFAYENLTKGTSAEGSALEVASAPVVLACSGCQWTGPMGSGPFTCPSCGTKDAEIIGGKEMYLQSLEIEENDT